MLEEVTKRGELERSGDGSGQIVIKFYSKEISGNKNCEKWKKEEVLNHLKVVFSRQCIQMENHAGIGTVKG